MSRLFAIALRGLLASSLLLGGAGVHADAPATTVEAATPPCHGGAAVDAEAVAQDAVPSPDSIGHCRSDCRCACMALPMLMPVAFWLPSADPAIPAALPGPPPWHSATVLPSLRPPIG